jgi:hypothetical protein
VSSFNRLTLEMVDGPLDGLKLHTRDYGLSFPVVLSFTFMIEDKPGKAKIDHYKFEFQFMDDSRHTKRGALYMHQKTIEINCEDRKDGQHG